MRLVHRSNLLAGRRETRSPAGSAALVFAIGLLPWSSSVASELAATARYVPDRECAGCHAELAQSFAGVGMGRSFVRPRREDLIEPLGVASQFEHAVSGRRYSMRWEGDRLVFRRSRPTTDGAEKDVLELPVDWILGSGNKARTYLFGNEAGELFQLPIAWYPPDGRWGMAPGFDRPDHVGVQRRVLRECMFCHNAYPEEPGEGSDAWDAPDRFPRHLPEGIGCQRCHGPGSEHVRAARSGGSADALRSSIVDPAELSPERRDDVCDACHLQPSVAIFGVRREGRTDNSWRPGERLDDFLAKVDVEEAGVVREERFEINHHPYRLRQSRCFLASGRALSCLTCHDPHRRITAAEDPEHFRAACLGCHQRSRDLGAGAASQRDSYHANRPDRDCVSCHMPQRRTSDVVHAVMTDHRIARPPVDPAALVAPRTERDPEIEDLFLTTAAPHERREATLERLLAVLQAVPHAEAAARLEALLLEADATPERPWTVLGVAQLQLGQLDGARRSFERVLSVQPDGWLAHRQLAVTLSRLGDRAGAIERIERAIELEPLVPELHYNRGVLLLAEGRAGDARASLERAVELRPTLAEGWAYLGVIARRRGELEDAERHFARADAIDPGNGIVARERAPPG
ncbi:MAG TPA: tetratricopeptide repeat protein [Thermoanaerobaculia bacterium]|nr:tetratricopeptide repeat protein [Thermoanaerobaculia bacterium]